MDASLDIVAKLNDILPNPGCVYEALEPILESCQTPERLEERTWLGIRLSICEFQAANVNFPAVCADRRSISACTQLLETKATWWTTFSGNYRHISAVCLEYQPHFESQKVLGTFKDASRLFAEYQDEIDRALSDYRTAKADSVQEWQLQAAELSGALADIVVGLSSLGQQLRTTSQNATELLSPLASAVDLAEARLTQAVVSSQFLADQAAQVSQRVAAFNCVMADVEARHMRATKSLQSTVDVTISSLRTEIKSLQSVLTGVKAAISVLATLIRFFWPLIAVFVGILLIWLLGARRGTRKVPAEPGAVDECDLVFY